MNPLPLILFILFVVIKLSSKKQKSAAAAQKRRPEGENAARADDAQNMAAPESEGREAYAPYAAYYGEGSWGEGVIGPEAAGTEGSISAEGAGGARSQRRRPIPARDAAAEDVPEEEGVGGGTIRGYTLIEEEYRKKAVAGAAPAELSRLTHRLGEAYESSFAATAGGAQPAKKAAPRSSLVFSEDPVVNGIIWSEILKRPSARRR